MFALALGICLLEGNKHFEGNVKFFFDFVVLFDFDWGMIEGFCNVCFIALTV